MNIYAKTWYVKEEYTASFEHVLTVSGKKADNP